MDIQIGNTVSGDLSDMAGAASLGLPGLGVDIENSVDLDAEAVLDFHLAFDVSDAGFGGIIGLPGLLAPGISMITYDVPNLEFAVEKEIAFRVFGPLAVTIGGGFTAVADIEVGYSTRGMVAEGANFFNGFFLGADAEEGGGVEPIAQTTLTLAAGAAPDAAIARAGVEGGVTGTYEINLASQDAQGRTCLGHLDFSCPFDDISGVIGALVRAMTSSSPRTGSIGASCSMAARGTTYWPRACSWVRPLWTTATTPSLVLMSRR